jgi:dipeptidyl aminopeptidase/acylaminoacyl peptidase
VTDDVAKVINRALAKSPADRFRTTDEMAAALALTTKPEEESRPTRSKPAFILVTVTVVVTLAGAGFWRWMNTERSSPLGFGQTAQLTFDPGLEIDPALSPDGNWLAFSSGSWGGMHIHLRQVSGGGTVDLTSGLPGDHRWPQWSPDGTQILFQANGRIFVIPALGGAPRTVVDNPEWVSTSVDETGVPGSASWSPDGSQMAFTVADTIFLMSEDGSGITPLAVDFEPHSLRWSPDGSNLVYVSGNKHYVLGTFTLANGAPSAIHMISVLDGAVVSLTDRANVHQGPVWLPSGDRILYISDEGGAKNIYEVVLTSSGRPSGAPFRLTTNLGALTLSLSADGRPEPVNPDETLGPR